MEKLDLAKKWRIVKRQENYCNQLNKWVGKLIMEQPTTVAARSEAWVWGRLPAGIAGSKPGGNMEVCLLWMLCVVRRRADHSSRGVLRSWYVWGWSWSLDEEALAH